MSPVTNIVFRLRGFDGYPVWANEKMPGEIMAAANKYSGFPYAS